MHDQKVSSTADIFENPGDVLTKSGADEKCTNVDDNRVPLMKILPREIGVT